MSQYTDAKVKTFTAGEAIEENRLVYLSGDDTVSKATAGRTAIGVARATVASGEQVGVALLNGQGSHKIQVSGAVTQFAAVYPSSDGKAGAAVNLTRIGLALEAATADGDIIEVLNIPAIPPDDAASQFTLFDDFLDYVPASSNEGLWTATLTDSGAVTLGDTVGGMLVIAASDGSVADNDEAYLSTTNEVFLFAANKPLYFETRLKLAADDSSLSNVANVIAGVVSAVGANTLLDNGGGPPASYSGAVFYKVDQGTAWAAEASIAGTQTAVTLTSPGRPGTSYQKLGIEVLPTSSTVATVRFLVDGALVGSTAAFTYTSATEMNAVVGVKNGDGTTNTTLHVDYIRCTQVR